ASKVGRLSRDSGRHLVGPVQLREQFEMGAPAQYRFARPQESAGGFVISSRAVAPAILDDTASTLRIGPLASIGPVYWNGTHPSVFEFRVEKNGTTTSMPQELLFELNGARVTPHIATFGGTSYQISNIGSVRVMQRKKYNPLAVIIFLLGLGILAAAIIKSRMTGLAEESFSMAATGIAVVIGSFLLQLIWPLRVYVLVLRTSSGDADAITSRNKEFVSNVQKAVEQAFVVRVRQPPVSGT